MAKTYRFGIFNQKRRLGNLQRELADCIAALPIELLRIDRGDDSPLATIPESDRSLVRQVVGLFQNCLSRSVQLLAICEDTYKCRRMARRYPWANKEISKSDHLYFVWFSFTNQCYLFRERTKLFSNDYNKLRKVFGDAAIDVSASLKEIDKGLGDHIRHRGQHIHEFHNDHVTYRMVSIAEIAAAGGYADRLNIKPDAEFRASKWHMGFEIEKSLGFMLDSYSASCSDSLDELKKYALVIQALLRNDGKYSIS